MNLGIVCPFTLALCACAGLLFAVRARVSRSRLSLPVKLLCLLAALCVVSLAAPTAKWAEIGVARASGAPQADPGPTLQEIIGGVESRPVENGRSVVRLGDEVEVGIECHDDDLREVDMGFGTDNSESLVIRVGVDPLIDNIDLRLLGRREGEVVRILYDPQASKDEPEDGANVVNIEITIVKIVSETAEIDDRSLILLSEAQASRFARMEAPDTFAVYYHLKDSADADERITEVEYGQDTKTLTIGELGYFRRGKRFMGWKVYRSDIDCWLVSGFQNDDEWLKALPQGGAYHLLPSGVTVSSIAHFGAEVHFYAQWEDTESFMVYYHKDNEAEASRSTTEIRFGVRTATLTTRYLGFDSPKMRFLGWRAYRPDRDCWRVYDADGVVSWSRTLPEGGRYCLYEDGISLKEFLPAGYEVHLYAQWENLDAFTVFYHRTDFDDASAATTEVTYGESTRTLSYDRLGFSIRGKRFAGWKAYRTDTQCWRVVDADGKTSWAKRVPEGGTYYLYANEAKLRKAVPRETELHFYAQWEDTDQVSVRCYLSEEGPAKLKTSVAQGEPIELPSWQSLGGAPEGKWFAGWKLYRTDTQSWRVLNPGGRSYWSRLMPEGYTFCLYGDQAVVSDRFNAGAELRFYAQWESETTIYYCPTDFSEADPVTTTARYDAPAQTLSSEALQFFIDGKRFAGWRMQRLDTQCWSMLDGDGEMLWSQHVPEGGRYCLYPDGFTLDPALQIGRGVRLYAQWEDTDVFTVYYHADDLAVASELTTEVTYGEKTRTRTIQELGFSSPGKVFAGWKIYRPSTQDWFITDRKGQSAWAQRLSEGDSYLLKSDGCTLQKSTKPGSSVHFYAQWKDPQG